MASQIKGLKDSRTFVQSSYRGAHSRGEAPVVDEQSAHEKLQEEINGDIFEFTQQALVDLPKIISTSDLYAEHETFLNNCADSLDYFSEELPAGIVISSENLLQIEKVRALHVQALAVWNAHARRQKKEKLDGEFDALFSRILDAKKRIHGVRVFAQRTSLDELRESMSKFELEYQELVDDISNFLHDIREYGFEETRGTKDMEDELASVHQELSKLSAIYTQRNAPSSDKFHERFDEVRIDSDLSVVEERIVGFQDASWEAEDFIANIRRLPQETEKECAAALSEINDFLKRFHEFETEWREQAAAYFQHHGDRAEWPKQIRTVFDSHERVLGGVQELVSTQKKLAALQKERVIKTNELRKEAAAVSPEGAEQALNFLKTFEDLLIKIDHVRHLPSGTRRLDTALRPLLLSVVQDCEFSGSYWESQTRAYFQKTPRKLQSSEWRRAQTAYGDVQKAVKRLKQEYRVVLLDESLVESPKDIAEKELAKGFWQKGEEVLTLFAHLENLPRTTKQENVALQEAMEHAIAEGRAFSKKWDLEAHSYLQKLVEDRASEWTDALRVKNQADEKTREWHRTHQRFFGDKATEQFVDRREIQALASGKEFLQGCDVAIAEFKRIRTLPRKEKHGAMKAFVANVRDFSRQWKETMDAYFAETPKSDILPVWDAAKVAFGKVMEVATEFEAEVQKIADARAVEGAAEAALRAENIALGERFFAKANEILAGFDQLQRFPRTNPQEENAFGEMMKKFAPQLSEFMDSWKAEAWPYLKTVVPGKELAVWNDASSLYGDIKQEKVIFDKVYREFLAGRAIEQGIEILRMCDAALRDIRRIQSLRPPENFDEKHQWRAMADDFFANFDGLVRTWNVDAVPYLESIEDKKNVPPVWDSAFSRYNDVARKADAMRQNYDVLFPPAAVLEGQGMEQSAQAALDALARLYDMPKKTDEEKYRFKTEAEQFLYHFGQYEEYWNEFGLPYLKNIKPDDELAEWRHAVAIRKMVQEQKRRLIDGYRSFFGHYPPDLEMLRERVAGENAEDLKRLTQKVANKARNKRQREEAKALAEEEADEKEFTARMAEMRRQRIQEEAEEKVRAENAVAVVEPVFEASTPRAEALRDHEKEIRGLLSDSVFWDADTKTSVRATKIAALLKKPVTELSMPNDFGLREDRVEDFYRVAGFESFEDLQSKMREMWKKDTEAPLPLTRQDIKVTPEENMQSVWRQEMREPPRPPSVGVPKRSKTSPEMLQTIENAAPLSFSKPDVAPMDEPSERHEIYPEQRLSSLAKGIRETFNRWFGVPVDREDHNKSLLEHSDAPSPEQIDDTVRSLVAEKFGKKSTYRLPRYAMPQSSEKSDAVSDDAVEQGQDSPEA